MATLSTLALPGSWKLRRVKMVSTCMGNHQQVTGLIGKLNKSERKAMAN